MKNNRMVCIIFFVILLIAPATVRAEFYFGLYGGGSFIPDVDSSFEFYRFTDPYGSRYVDLVKTARDVKVDPAPLVGGKIGYWFARDSYFGLKSPVILKHLGFELDVSYQPFNWPSQTVLVNNQYYTLKNDGNAITVAFMFLFRLGFLKDTDVPFGRLQPYLGIGPTIFVATTHLNTGSDFRSTEADLGLAIEPGIRYMIFKNLSAHLSFRFRYVNSHVDVDERGVTFGEPGVRYINMRTGYNLYDVTLGVAYHF